VTATQSDPCELHNMPEGPTESTVASPGWLAVKKVHVEPAGHPPPTRDLVTARIAGSVDVGVDHGTIDPSRLND